MNSRPNLQGLFLAAVLALGLLLLSFARIVGDTQSAAFSSTVLDSVLAGPIWTTALGRNLALFGLTLIALHLCLGLLCWVLARLSEKAWPAAAVSRHKWVTVWFGGLTLWILTANAAWFPHSSLGAPYARLVRAEWFGLNLFVVASIILITTLIMLGGRIIAKSIQKKSVGRRHVAAIAAVAFTLAAIAVVPVAVSRKPDAELRKPPHVILIGIDSLRRDFTRLGGGSQKAPHIDRFLGKSVGFSDAMTPLARTFPSWVSLLTGRHPHTTGALINLLPREMIDAGDTLGDMIKRAGYRTVYAIDEVRFSNLDASYGFDQVIAPRMGATDFLLGWFGDTPLSNLVVNSALGSVLFPYNYTNRGAALTYSPDEFVNRLGRELNFTQPTFFALHLTLAHWPFGWADSPFVGDELDDYSTAYEGSVERVDRQFADVLTMLEHRGALDNAIVVLFSDHGEGLGLEKDSLVAKQSDEVAMKEYGRGHLYGHGTSVLSPYQYGIVLAMRGFGSARNMFPAGEIVDAPVSLEDITPTLADMLKLDPHSRFDGRSLMPLLEKDPPGQEFFVNRVRFTETEFNPRGFTGVGAPSTSAAADAALYYRVDPVTDRIQVRREKALEMLAKRQYAAILGNRMLAALPEESPGKFKFILVDREGNTPQWLDGIPDWRKDPELARLWNELQAKFSVFGSASPISSGS